MWSAQTHRNHDCWCHLFTILVFLNTCAEDVLSDPCAAKSPCPDFFLENTFRIMSVGQRYERSLQKPIVISRKENTHTHLQLWTVKARWKETADWTFQEWQLKDTVADLWQRLKTNSGTLKIHRVWEPGREPLVYTTDLIHFIVSCTLLCFMQVPLMSAECAICTSLSDKQSQSRI